MTRRRALRGLPLLIVASLSGPHALAAPSEVLDARQAFRLSARVVDGSVAVRYRVADGYYLYRDKFKFSVAPVQAAAGRPDVPKGTVKDDEFFGRVETLRGEVLIRIPLAKGGNGPVTLTATSQGCADAGVCYPPRTDSLTLSRDGVEVEMAGRTSGPSGKSLLDALEGK